MNESLYLKIREERIKQGLSQKELGEMVGLPQQAINRIEQGQRKLDVELFEKLCQVLKIKKIGSFSVDFISSYYQTDIEDTSTNIILTDSDVAEYNRIIEKQKHGEGFTPYDKRFISDYIDKSPLVREWFIENGLKSKEKNLERIQSAYEHLNENGRKEAAKRIKELTEIERYTKPEEWFKGRIAKEEIDKAVKAYLNDEATDEPPQE